jgi:hypothetical protein
VSRYEVSHVLSRQIFDLSTDSASRSLALCELYLSLSALALRVMPHMRLHDTVDADLAYDHDMFIPMTKDNRGVRLTIE